MTATVYQVVVVVKEIEPFVSVFEYYKEPQEEFSSNASLYVGAANEYLDLFKEKYGLESLIKYPVETYTENYEYFLLDSSKGIGVKDFRGQIIDNNGNEINGLLSSTEPKGLYVATFRLDEGVINLTLTIDPRDQLSWYDPYFGIMMVYTDKQNFELYVEEQSKLDQAIKEKMIKEI